MLSQTGIDFAGVNTAGLDLHNAITAAGYKTVLIPPATMLNYLAHLNHRTLVLHPSLGGLKQKTVDRGMRRINQFLAEAGIQSIYNDQSLDR